MGDKSKLPVKYGSNKSAIINLARGNTIVDNEGSKLIELFRRGPTLLFLGQSYLRLGSNLDPFLADILNKYGSDTSDISNYSSMFQTDAYSHPKESLAWMHGRSERTNIPSWFSIIADFAWNNFYTSAIDSVWDRALRSNWRELQPITEESFNPLNPRNRLRLNCTSLFGRVDRDIISQRPPLSKREWYKRKQIAVILARRIPEIVTPLGVIVIDG